MHKDIRAKVTEKGTVVVQGRDGPHEGYVDVNLAGETVTVSKFGKEFRAVYRGIVLPIVSYTGQDEKLKAQLELFKEVT